MSKLKIENYLVYGAKSLFDIQLKSAYDNLNFLEHAQSCLETMKSIYEDILSFDKMGLTQNGSHIYPMGKEIEDLTNKLSEIREIQN